MLVQVTTFDDDPRTVYEIKNYPVKVVVQPSPHEGEVYVELWDEAGLSDRVTRTAEQAHANATKTLVLAYRADQSEQVATD